MRSMHLLTDGQRPKTNATKAQRHQEFNEYFPLCLGVFVATKKFFYKIYNFSISSAQKKPCQPLPPQLRKISENITVQLTAVCRKRPHLFLYHIIQALDLL